ncbi:MAG: MFS transporter [Legionella sp.]|nr:MFS transporter [Legionella sp.]
MRLNLSTKALLIAVSGTILQWYDFALFGYFASIIASTYFPNSSTFAGLLNTFILFAVGYLLAPLGSIIFGYIGDCYGRKKALTISILAMAIPTALMSIVPGYQVIGIAAPILIMLLRIMQGFVASAEYTGSAIFLVEHAPAQKKAFYGCLTSSAYSGGLILAGLSASFFTASFMPDWGWRVGFGFALIAGIIIFFLRTRILETPEYQQLSIQEKPKFPFMTALKESPFAIVGVIGIAWMVGIITFGTYVFTATYLHSFFKLPLSTATFIITISLTVDAFLEPWFAIIADKIGYLKVIRVGLAILLLFTIPLFYLLSSGQTLWIMAGMMLLSCIIAIICAPLNAYMVLLFPKQYRFSGFGVAFHIGITIFGGTTPLVMMWLLHSTNNLTAPAWYYVFGAFIGLCSLVICEYGRSKRVVYVTV